MKKALAVLLSFLIILTLSGCSSLMDAVFPELKRPAGESGSPDEWGYLELPEGTVIIDGGQDVAAVRQAMQDALSRREKHVAVKNYIPFDWRDFYAFEYSTFWLDSYTAYHSLSARLKGDTETSSVYLYEFKYADLLDSEIELMKTKIDVAASRIASKVPKDADVWQKAKIVHDELCRLVTYDKSLSQPHCHDSYGALVNGNAVCSGYACAFTTVMSRLGEFCPIVYSEDHAWNRIGARTYEEFIDVTWDDTGHADKDGNEYISYAYFGLTREEVLKVDSHSITGGSDAVLDYAADPIAFNYYKHEGYYLTGYNENTIVRKLKEQLGSGSNMLTLRFDDEGWKKVKAWEEDSSALRAILGRVGVEGRFSFWFTDDFNVVCIGLNK